MAARFRFIRLFRGAQADITVRGLDIDPVVESVSLEICIDVRWTLCFENLDSYMNHVLKLVEIQASTREVFASCYDFYSSLREHT
jgi:hypothetical protein